MNIHEYQAKEVLADFGVPVAKRLSGLHGRRGGRRRPRSCGGPVWVVKAQIHAGGRGKGKFKEAAGVKGGVRLAKSVDEVEADAKRDARQARWSRTRPARRASRSTASISRKARTSRREFYLSIAGRPRDVARRLRRLDRRRHGHRGGRARHAGEDRHRSRSIRPPASCRITAARVARRSASTGDQAKQCVKLIGQLYTRLRRART